MSKSLDALKRIVATLTVCKKLYLNKSAVEEIEKDIEALEIIKREPLEVINLIDCYETYEQMIEDYYAYGDEVRFIKSKEEFDLLKEVLYE